MNNNKKLLCLNDIEHIIWDYNGTLLNDLDVCVDVINSLLIKRGLEKLSHDAYKAVFDFPVKDYYAKIGFDFQKESFEIVGTEFIDKYNLEQQKCELQYDALKLIRSFSALGLGQSILSARLQESLEDEINAFGIEPYFTNVFGLDHHYADGKLERGRQLVKTINIDPKKILFIGDTLHDLDVADKLKIKCLLIAHGHHSYKRLRARSENVFQNLTEVSEILDQQECPEIKHPNLNSV